DRKPTIDPIANQVIDEGAPFTLQLTGTELDKEDQDKISFRMENLPQGATFDQVTNTFQWTPTYDQSGTYENIVAIMQAGVLSDTTIFSITVNHVNRAPVLADVEDQQVDENSNLSFTISGSDPDVEDQGKLVFQALNLPEGATFDAATRTFSWTPTYEQSGIYSDIQFQVMDPSGLKDSKTMTITVNHVNRPPKLMAVEPSVIDENELLSYTLSANDPDKEDDGKLRFSAMGLPEGASLDPVSGQFQWTPTYDQSGEYAIIFMVSDGQYQDSSQTTITVNHVNRPPVLTPLPVFTVDENKSLVFNVEGSDPDKEDAGKLSFTISNLPEGATFDPLTRQFQWTPTYEQSGEYLLPVSVTDPGGLSAQQDVRLVVHHVNRPPQLNPIPPIVLNERELVSFQLMGTDPDKEDTGRLSYSLTPIPEGANFNPKTGEFVWTPTYEQSGSYTLTAVVSDADGLQDTKEIVITVNNVNRKPRFLPMSSPEGKENSLLNFNLQATDPDKEDEGKLRFSAASLPEGATLNPQTGEFRWTPTYDQSGSYPIVFTVEDAEGASASVELTISVIHVNRAPNLPSPGTLSFTEGQRAGYKLPEGTDPDPEDAGKLTYHIKNAPGGIEFDPETRMLSWTPSFDQAGEYQAIYWVSDGQAHKEQPLILVVENVNQPPTIEAPGVQTVNEGQELTFEIKAIDPDKEDQGKLKVSASNVPAGASFNGTEFRWTPGFDQQGTYTINFTV
ncbi:MAG: tandem-95 repeat protein, partial [Methanobacteriota archaeon]